MARKRVPTESADQIKFVARVRHFHPEVIIFAIPNGGGRSGMEATKLKEEGVLAGVSDLLVAEPRGNYHGLFIEMKRAEGGHTSKQQWNFLRDVRRRGYHGVVAEGVEEAWRIFEEYMELEPWTI